MRQSRYRLVPAMMILVATIVLPGCALQNLPPVAVYTLDPGWSEGNPSPIEKKGPVVVQIAPVRGSAVFTATEIFYTDSRHIQHSYAYSRWRDAPVKSMQMVLEVILEKSGLFRAVLPPTSVSGADLVLESSLLEFGHFLGGNGTSEGVVRMRVHLVDNKSREVIAGTELGARMPAATLDAHGATTAINQAALKVADELVSWLRQELTHL